MTNGRRLEVEDRVDDVARSRPSGPSGAARPGPSYVSGSCIGVLMTPGATALTRTPRAAYSMASDLVTAASPPLVSDASADGTLTRLVDEAGRDVDDVAAALGEHLPDGALGDVEEPGEVHAGDQRRSPRRCTP